MLTRLVAAAMIVCAAAAAAVATAASVKSDSEVRPEARHCLTVAHLLTQAPPDGVHGIYEGLPARAGIDAIGRLGSEPLPDGDGLLLSVYPGTVFFAVLNKGCVVKTGGMNATAALMTLEAIDAAAAAALSETPI